MAANASPCPPHWAPAPTASASCRTVLGQRRDLLRRRQPRGQLHAAPVHRQRLHAALQALSVGRQQLRLRHHVLPQPGSRMSRQQVTLWKNHGKCVRGGTYWRSMLHYGNNHPNRTFTGIVLSRMDAVESCPALLYSSLGRAPGPARIGLAADKRRGFHDGGACMDTERFAHAVEELTCKNP